MAKILVVDDDETIRCMLTKMLAMDSHNVTTANNGIHALDCLRRQLPDVVIMDIIMPEKEGFETIREIRRDYPKLKIIAISGGGYIGATSYLKLAKTLGANLTIEKPLHMSELLAAVQQLVRAEAR